MVEVDAVEDVVDVEVDVVAAALVVVAGVEMASAVRSVRCPGEPRRYFSQRTSGKLGSAGLPPSLDNRLDGLTDGRHVKRNPRPGEILRGVPRDPSSVGGRVRSSSTALSG